MLHSMIENAAPTKAEVADITNAVFDGCAGLMLSGETAVGEFPFDACKIMKDTALVTEEALPTRERSLAPKANSKTPEIIAQAIWMASKELPVTKIVCFTNSGYSARVISSQRPRQSVIAVTDQIEKAREFNLYYGVEGVVLRDIQFRPTEAEYVIQGLRSLFVSGNISMDDTIIVTAVRFPNPPRNTYMNYFEVHNVEDLAEVFNW